MTAFQIPSLSRFLLILSLFTWCPSSDVIELSSGDDDALQISSGSDDEDKDDRSGSPGADESSGAHVNDAHNQPDPQGRVLVNMNHPPEEEDLYLAPQLARAVKPHQVPPHSIGTTVVELAVNSSVSMHSMSILCIW